jgi:hypothetical protein
MAMPAAATGTLPSVSVSVCVRVPSLPGETANVETDELDPGLGLFSHGRLWGAQSGLCGVSVFVDESSEAVASFHAG